MSRRSRRAPGTGDFGATEITVVAATATNGFESRADRSGIGLRPEDPAERVGPMRFVGSDRPGSQWSALLESGERMLVTRQALAAGARAWHASFTTSAETDGMTCGMLLADRTERAEPCDAIRGLASATLEVPSDVAPILFWVELPRGHAPVAIDDLSIDVAR